ncbi:hypothetical protein PLICRDRAFT_272636 [Plicaturopsis crispa FD-325 SS-3]|nr:hypothetical protein PLICRDRAFT_272636 [Plicaturopsis crispa FD-325 SS-3]
MAINHDNMATQIPQSLPSFAQAFSASSFNSISAGNNSLPPIQSRHSSQENAPRIHSHSPAGHRQERTRTRTNTDAGTTSNARKRSLQEVASAADDDASDSDHHSPRLIRIKEEEEDTSKHRQTQEYSAPPPSSLRPTPSNKRRRVTISGAPHPLDTDLRTKANDQGATTPISPAVMGFTLMPDDPKALQQVRSMITVKQKQKALIEQRRGSAAGVMMTTPTSNGPSNLGATSGSANAPNDRPAQRQSPNSGHPMPGSRRVSIAAPPITQNVPEPHPPSPAEPPVPSQQPVAQSTPTASLPPPPISFARRRATKLGTLKKKPADILISPRDAHTAEQLAPSIQSAPPVPHAGRFPMALPRLPFNMGAEQSARKIPASQVPPTPTRLAAMQRAGLAGPSDSSNLGIAGPSGTRGSPPASVPIATTLIPPTPSSLHHPSYSGSKSAFLAPFEIFYDALNDSKQLKTWLGEQMQKSNALMQTLTAQQEHMDEHIERLVEKKMGPVLEEVSGLRRRVEELEEALRVVTGSSSRRGSIDPSQGGRFRSSISVSNVPTSYAFPPVHPLDGQRPEPARHASSPGWGRDHDREGPASENGSPAPFDSRRISVSAMRLDPPRPQPESSRPPFNAPSLPPPPSAYPRSTAPAKRTPPQPAHALPERPDITRTPSTQRMGQGPAMSQSRSGHAPRDAGKHAESSQSPRIGRSRRGSIVSPPSGHSPPMDLT